MELGIPMDKRRQSILRPEGRIPLQEMMIPDFPDDDTATVTVTKSRRVSFGANFVKEFIVGSAVSTECYSEYEQAVCSSDSSNPNSSRSGILDQSTFSQQCDALDLCINKTTLKNENSEPSQKWGFEKNRSECHERSTDENWEFNVTNSNIFGEKRNGGLGKAEAKGPINHRRTNQFNGSVQAVEKSMQNKRSDSDGSHHRLNDTIDRKSKQGKFSSTICFSADSPTADMEFTEGCISLAKSIFDKKKKEMTVYIQAKNKDSESEEKKDFNDTLIFEGSDIEMCLTKCADDNSRTEVNFNNLARESFSDETTPWKSLGSNYDDSDENIENIPPRVYPLNVMLDQGDDREDDTGLERALFFPERSLTEMLNCDRSDLSTFDSPPKTGDNCDSDMEMTDVGLPGAVEGKILRRQSVDIREVSMDLSINLSLNGFVDHENVVSRSGIEKCRDTPIGDATDCGVVEQGHSGIERAKRCGDPAENDAESARVEPGCEKQQNSTFEMMDAAAASIAEEEEIPRTESAGKELDDSEMKTIFVPSLETEQNVQINDISQSNIVEQEMDLTEHLFRRSFDKSKDSEIASIANEGSDTGNADEEADAIAESALVPGPKDLEISNDEMIESTASDNAQEENPRVDDGMEEVSEDAGVKGSDEEGVENEKNGETENTPPKSIDFGGEVPPAENLFQLGGDEREGSEIENMVRDSENRERSEMENVIQLTAEEEGDAKMERVHDLDPEGGRPSNDAAIDNEPCGVGEQNDDAEAEEERCSEKREDSEMKGTDEGHAERNEKMEDVPMSVDSENDVADTGNICECSVEPTDGTIGDAPLCNVDKRESSNVGNVIHLTDGEERDTETESACQQVADGEISNNEMICDATATIAEGKNSQTDDEEGEDEDVDVKTASQENEEAENIPRSDVGERDFAQMENVIQRNVEEEEDVGMDCVPSVQEEEPPIPHVNDDERNASQSIVAEEEEDVDMEHVPPPVSGKGDSQMENLPSFDVEKRERDNSDGFPRNRAEGREPADVGNTLVRLESEKSQSDVVPSSAVKEKGDAQVHMYGSAKEESGASRNGQPSLGDKKIMHLLGEQAQEPNCCWRIEDFSCGEGSAVWFFSFSLFDSVVVMTFKLKFPRDSSIISFSHVTDRLIELKESAKHQSDKDKTAVGYAFERLKRFFDEESRKADTVPKIPFFLDKMNLHAAKMKSFVSQILEVLKGYPGSRLNGSILTFRLYSYPLMFSCMISVNVNDPFHMSEECVAVEKHFGSFPETTIKAIFNDSLTDHRVVIRFVCSLNQCVIDKERKGGSITNRRHIRLLAETSI